MTPMTMTTFPRIVLALLFGAAEACSSTPSAPAEGTHPTMDSGPLGDGSPGSPSAHTVTLSWNASPTPGVTYTVLRSTTAGSGYASQASGLSSLTWTDTAVQSGTTYYYVVDDSLGSATSTFSNQATAAIP
jgi:hypothetical protein